MIYADEEGAKLAGLRIRPEVKKDVEHAFPGCIDCGVTPAPPGRFAMTELAVWAGSQKPRTKLSPALDRASGRCAVCSSARITVIGIPLKMLFRVLNRLRGPERRNMEQFIEARFVFPLCVGCAEAPSDEDVTAREIEGRYRRARAEMRDADLAPAGTDTVADELMLLITEDIRTQTAG